MTEALGFAFRLAELSRRLRESGRHVATAESCTGGLLAGALTDLPDASETFVGGVVTYATDRKASLLKVPAEVLEREGAVSATTAALMAQAVCRLLDAQLGISVTGVAGPSEQEGKPAGLIYVGACLDGHTVTKEHRFNAGRGPNRLAAVEAAIELAIEMVERTGVN